MPVRVRYVPALDGLLGVAVDLGILFALSGLLVTSLLLKEPVGKGRVERMVAQPQARRPGRLSRSRQPSIDVAGTVPVDQRPRVP
jgi:hypothetical protein